MSNERFLYAATLEHIVYLLYLPPTLQRMPMFQHDELNKSRLGTPSQCLAQVIPSLSLLYTRIHSRSPRRSYGTGPDRGGTHPPELEMPPMALCQMLIPVQPISVLPICFRILILTSCLSLRSTTELSITLWPHLSLLIPIKDLLIGLGTDALNYDTLKEERHILNPQRLIHPVTAILVGVPLHRHS
jgi:hypothetical protein